MTTNSALANQLKEIIDIDIRYLANQPEFKHSCLVMIEKKLLAVIAQLEKK